MKKFCFIAAIAAMFGFASCCGQKCDAPETVDTIVEEEVMTDECVDSLPDTLIVMDETIN